MGSKPARNDDEIYAVMIRQLLLAICFIVASNATAQINERSSDSVALPNSSVDVKPEFPGGIPAFYQFIAKHYKKPKAAKDIKGRLILNFVIDPKGKVTDIKVIRDLGHGTGEEAIRVLKKSPRWLPGRQNGQFVRVQYSLPLVL